MIQGKLIRKIREDPNMKMISLIPEQLGEYTDSALIQPSAAESEMLQNSSESKKGTIQGNSQSLNVFTEMNNEII